MRLKTGGKSEATAEIAERLLPVDRDPASLASELAFWSERSGFDLALLSPAGEVIAKAGASHDIAPANHELRMFTKVATVFMNAATAEQSCKALSLRLSGAPPRGAVDLTGV